MPLIQVLIVLVFQLFYGFKIPQNKKLGDRLEMNSIKHTHPKISVSSYRLAKGGKEHGITLTYF